MRFHSNEVLKLVKFIETEKYRGVVFRGLRREGNGELVFNGYRNFSFARQKEMWRWIDGGDGKTIMWMYLMPLNCTLKMVILCVFYSYLKFYIKRRPTSWLAYYVILLGQCVLYQHRSPSGKPGSSRGRHQSFRGMVRVPLFQQSKQLHS